MAEEEIPVTSTPGYKRLKAIVIVLGVLIVIGFSILIGTIAFRMVNMMSGEDGEPPAENASVPMVLGEYGTYDIIRPVGSELIGVEANGPEILLHFRLNDGGDVVVAVNRDTGNQYTVLTVAE